MWFERSLACGIAALTALGTPASGQGQSVVDTRHNLSVSGPGDIRAATEQEVCIFCHTPHRSAPIQPLWNRQASATPYTVYNSSALDADTGQPTGASKLCLSCHDGSIALGSVLSREQIIAMAGGITTLPPGSSNLGTDLSDDHPISFRYTSALAAEDTRLSFPETLTEPVRLDANGELQCTSCHDAHDNSFGDFLVMDNAGSTLCRTCHQISNTNISAHMDCTSCHRSHSAPSGPFLLVENTVTDTCMSCHDGSYSGAADLSSEMSSLDVHDTDSPVDPSDPGPHHSDCADCHEPHTMKLGTPARAPGVASALGDAPGVNSSGADVARSTFEYEICYRCHADQNQGFVSITRQITQVNTRWQFDIGAASYHPIEGPGRNFDVPSLKPGWTESSVMLCSDCHGSGNSRKAGGSGPNGVHGSNHRPLLLARYDTIDRTPESVSAYALCYRCHYRDGFDGILGDRSFPHQIHVVDSQTPCSVCHDAHGVDSIQGNAINNSHLINFDRSVVSPDPITGRLEFVDMGTFSGSCTLTCHGVLHSPLSY